MPSNSVAIVWLVSRPILAIAWLIASFCIISWFLGTPASRSASASTRASSRPAGTASVTSPIAFASTPVARSPVSSMRLAPSAPSR